jgi:HK97 family phage prohead protease
MRYGAKSKPIRGQFRETFTAGAFTKTIQEQDVQSHNEHSGPYLARTGNNTLRLTDSRSELAYEIDLPDTTAGRDAAHLLERGDIKGSSIGFRALPKSEAWSVDGDGMALRSVSQARLGRVDLTILPYYDESTAELALRSLADEKGLELRSVLEAAERGELPTLIASPEGEDEEEQRSDDDGRETTVDRPRIAWLYS